MDLEDKIALNAVIGGTAEVLGGGKPVRPGWGGFTNGAVTGAYVMMFNHLMGDGEDDEPVSGESQDATPTELNTGGLPMIDGVAGPWSNTVVQEELEKILGKVDDAIQVVGFGVSLAGLSLKEVQFLQSIGKVSFYTGIAIAIVTTDFNSNQSIIEFSLGLGLSTFAYKTPIGLPFAAVYSAIMIDPEYSKTLPQRAAKGYRMSNQQIKNHPYFRNLD